MKTFLTLRNKYNYTVQKSLMPIRTAEIHNNEEAILAYTSLQSGLNFVRR